MLFNKRKMTLLKRREMTQLDTHQPIGREAATISAQASTAKIVQYMIVYAVCWVPLAVQEFLYTVDPSSITDTTLGKVYFFAAVCLANSQGLWNAVVFGFFEEMKFYFKLKFGRFKKSPPSLEEESLIPDQSATF